MDKIDLTGLREWSENEQEEMQELTIECASIFAMSDMDLGKTSLVKHSIRQTDNTPLRSIICGSHQACMRKSGNT